MWAPSLVKKIYRFLIPAKDSWSHFLAILDRKSLEHDPGLSPEEKRELFRRNVTLVELEPHAFCNRTCSFCPNSTIDRLTVKSTLDQPLYESILGDLQSIDYNHVVRFSRYSEPMAHEHIYEMVAMARERLPKAEIDIVTNGDYLNPKALSRLREAGLSVLRISVYMRHEVAWCVAAAQDEIKRLAKRIQITPVWNVCTETTVGVMLPYKKMKIFAFSHNFDEIGYDRGQLVTGLVDREYVRESPCFLVFSNFTVDFNGKVMPCCNLRSDHPQHERFVLGELARPEQSIFDVYASGQFTKWRRGLVKVGKKGYPCVTCKQKALDGPALMRVGREVESRLHKIGIQV